MMPSTIPTFTDISAREFRNLNSARKQQVFDSVNLADIRNDPALLNKYIVMRIMIEAANAGNKSAFNLTNHFNRSIGAGIHVDRDPGDSTGIRIWHLHDFGHSYYGQKYFFVLTDDDFSQITCKQYDMNAVDGFSDYHREYHENEQTKTYTDLTNPDTLRAIFGQIDEGSRYTNTLGYDLYQGVGWVATLPWLACCTLGLSLLLYPVVMPVAFLLTAIELLIVDPIKFLARSTSKYLGNDPVEQFIESVTSVETPTNSYLLSSKPSFFGTTANGEPGKDDDYDPAITSTIG